MALLHSPGPDGDFDIRLPRLYALINDCLPDRTAQNAGMGIPPRAEACLNAVLQRYGYDPSRGLGSSGDLILLYEQGRQRWLGYGRPSEASMKPSVAAMEGKEFEALLCKYSEDVSMPSPRWANQELQIAEENTDLFPVAKSHYEHFRAYLAPNDAAAEDALGQLSNRMGAFGEFFRELGELNEEQKSALRQWRENDPQWWHLIESAPGIAVTQSGGVCLPRHTPVCAFLCFLRQIDGAVGPRTAGPRKG